MIDIEIGQKISHTFHPSRTGFISETIAPLSNFDSLEDARRVFLENADLSSIPLEKDGGVIGLLPRETVLQKAKSTIELIKNRGLDFYIQDFSAIIDAHENAERALDYILLQPGDHIFKDFMIYNEGKFLGIGSFLKLTKHVSFLRNQDLIKAKTMQEYLMNSKEINCPGFTVSKFLKMLHELGGDYYQTMEIRKDFYLIACFDVSGKGIAASLTTGMISAFFSTMEISGTLANQLPEDIVRKINKLVINSTPDNVFVAGLMMFVDTAAQTIQFINLALSIVYIFYENESGKILGKILNPNLRPLGIDDFDNLEEEKRILPILKKMKVFIYTDGLTEARNESGEMFGDELLKKFLFSHCRESAETVVQELEKELKKYVGSAPQADDITLIGVQFN